jgi:hypothetical protein
MAPASKLITATLITTTTREYPAFIPLHPLCSPRENLETPISISILNEGFAGRAACVTLVVPSLQYIPGDLRALCVGT